MMIEGIKMTCLENKQELVAGSDYKETVYTARFAMLFLKTDKAPGLRGQLQIESDKPLPYIPGKVYQVRVTEDAGLVAATRIPDGLEPPTPIGA